MKAQLKSKLNLEKHIPLQDVIPLETPFLLYIDPSSACNFKCEFCPTGHKDLVRNSNYKRGIMDFEIFKKVIKDLGEFTQPLKVLRMNKIGEPFVNKELPEMIAFAKDSGFIESIDLATNGALFTHQNLTEIVDAGLDRLNISLEGINSQQYLKYAKVNIDCNILFENIRWLYKNKGNCEVTIKIPGSYLTDNEKDEFFNLFGDYCDRIFIEDIVPIWPSFDIEKNTDIKIDLHKGQYNEKVQQKDICTYIFYSLAINADGTVSACCPDWDQKLVVGDIRKQTLKEIWNSSKINDLRRSHLEGLRNKNSVCKDCGHLKYAQVDNIDQYRERLLKNFDQYEKEVL
ncbi:MAG: radical SAM/SPASM domain-containing protein [Bacteroidota bacterium]